MKSAYRNSGYSLPEIVAAVAILAVLAALLMPGTQRVIGVGKEAKCISNLRQLGAGFLAYAGDHGGKFPPYPTDTSDFTQAWPWLISSYVGYDRVNLTPAIFACPSGKKHPSYPIGALRGYSMNHYVSDPAFNNNTLSGAAQMLLVEEWGVAPGTDRDHVMWPALGSANNKTYQNYASSDRKARLAWRHDGGMNILRKDGSVIRSLPGQSGWGESIIWRIYDDGRKWRDGNLESSQ